MKICGPKLSLCGLVLSVWGIIQLTLMGVFYYIKAVALLEDLPLPEKHHSIEDFIADVETGYSLLIMGILFMFEVTAFIEEAETHDKLEYNNFILACKNNYQDISINCFIAVGIYVVTLLLSYVCIKKANKKAAEEALILKSDELSCNPPAPKPKKRSKKSR